VDIGAIRVMGDNELFDFFQDVYLVAETLEHHALRGAAQRSRLGRRRARLGPRPRRERRPDAGFVLEDLAAPPDHRAPQLAVLVAGLDHHRHPGIAADADDLLGLHVRGHGKAPSSAK
jgi:hypothetical protein